MNSLRNQLAFVTSVVISLEFSTSQTIAANVIGLDGFNSFINENSEFLFGGSGGANSLTLLLSDNTTVTLSTDQSEFTNGSPNQGWWSTNAFPPNLDTNDNYIVGVTSFIGTTYFNNFFTFDISSLSGTVVSATLNLQRYFGQSNLGNVTQSYSLYDVSTDAAVLNFNEGTNSAIFNDLGSGTNYGNYNVTVAGSDTEILNFLLNSSAISDLNNAILANSDFFSVGGTLNLDSETVPEPASILGILTVAGLGLSRKRKKRFCCKN